MVLRIFALIRYATTYLIFFFITACTTNSREGESISIVWKEDKAIAITIPRQFLKNLPDDSLKDIVTVHLVNGGNQPAILGENILVEEGVRFEPLIPFRSKYKYEVRIRNSKIGEITIPAPLNSKAPAILGVFPSQDTLPQNLLKFYFQFLQPMREGEALKHIFLVSRNDTVPFVFLDLQPELWNQERTMLTLWLDPGRIKRELQPNKKLGEPLEKNRWYELIVDPSWADAKGDVLAKTFSRSFFVSERDSLSPVMELWKIIAPKPGSRDALQVEFDENLDYVLVKEAIEILDEGGKPVAGEVILIKEESVYLFEPEIPWKTGMYKFQSEGRLEDLAGNNLNRVFDRDISQSTDVADKDFYSRKFRIE